MDSKKIINKKSNFSLTGKACVIFIVIDFIFKIVALTSQNYEINKNIFWGIVPISNKIIIIISFIILIYILYLCSVLKKRKFAWCFVLIGGLSNIIDRILVGGVIDYIRLESLTTFNLADVYICIGLVLLIMEIFYAKET